jgi:hypothetical protein
MHACMHVGTYVCIYECMYIYRTYAHGVHFLAAVVQVNADELGADQLGGCSEGLAKFLKRW